MKQTAIMDDIQDQMRPGRITRDGFLGRDTRKLVDILVADNATVHRLGLEHADIAARMRALRDAGKAGLGQTQRVAPHFEICVDSVRGKLPCPFGDQVFVAKLNTELHNVAKGLRIVYTDLNIHMIEAHGFYEGEGSGFRLDPAHLANVLDLLEA